MRLDEALWDLEEILDIEIEKYGLKRILKRAVRDLMRNHKNLLLKKLLEADLDIITISVPEHQSLDWRAFYLAKSLVRLHFAYLDIDDTISNLGLPDEICTDILTAFVKRDGNTLSEIPEHKQAERLRLEAVINDGLAIRHIPVNLQSEVIRLAAVVKNPEAIYNIPKNQRSDTVKLLASIGIHGMRAWF